MTTAKDFVLAYQNLQVTDLNSWKQEYDKLAGNFTFNTEKTPLASNELLFVWNIL